MEPARSGHLPVSRLKPRDSEKRVTRPAGPTDQKWDQHKGTITHLYWNEDRSLPDVRKKLEMDYDFSATEKQYKTKLKEWKLEKNLKLSEANIMIKIQSHREMKHGKATEFTLRKRQVPREKILRVSKRRQLSKSNTLIGEYQTGSTPPDIEYFTPNHETSPHDSNELQPRDSTTADCTTSIDDDIFIVNNAVAYDETIRRVEKGLFDAESQAQLNRQLRFTVKLGKLNAVNALLQRGAQVNSQGKSKMSAIDLASYMGHSAIVTALLDHGAMLKETEGDFIFRLDGHNEIVSGPHPVHLAALRGHLDTVRVLLHHCGYSPIDREDFDLFTWAIRRNNLELTEVLLKAGANPNPKTDNAASPECPMLVAAMNENETMIRMLRDHGADVNFPGLYRNPLALALLISDEKSCRLLFRYGAIIDDTWCLGSTTWLHYAVRRHDHGVVDMLLEHHADVNAVDESQRTPIHIAASQGATELVARSIKAGAKVNKRDAEGNSALHLAIRCKARSAVIELLHHNATLQDRNEQSENILHIAAYADCQSIVRLLFQHDKVDVTEVVNLRDHCAKTPLHIAAQNGSIPMVHYLLELSADINMQTEHGRALLHIAVSARSARFHDMLQAVLRQNPDIDVRSYMDGRTPLHCAVENGNYDAVVLLAKSGANVNIVDNGGRTPLELAVMKHYLEMAQFLAEWGIRRLELRSVEAQLRRGGLSYNNPSVAV